MTVKVCEHAINVFFYLHCFTLGNNTLNVLLQFISGASEIPPFGFPSGATIDFTDENCFPKVSTCSLRLEFSRAFGNISYEQFKEKMEISVNSSRGFDIV